jgi:hypothetical protein
VGGVCSTHGRDEKCELCSEKPEGKRTHIRLRRTWEDNIRMDPAEMFWEVVDWVHLAYNRDQLRALLNTVMNLLIQ